MVNLLIHIINIQPKMNIYYSYIEKYVKVVEYPKSYQEALNNLLINYLNDTKMLEKNIYQLNFLKYSKETYQLLKKLKINIKSINYNNKNIKYKNIYTMYLLFIMYYLLFY